MAEDIAFQRTQSGKAAKPLFVAEVICYVEGTDDVAFYTPISAVLKIRFEPAFGKPNLLDLARRLREGNLSYVVLMDGDLDELLGLKIHHPRIVYLECYAIENLLWSSDLIRRAVAEYAGVQESDIAEWHHLDDFSSSNHSTIRKVTVADLACRLENVGRGMVPSHCDQMLSGTHSMTIKSSWLAAFEAQMAAIPAGFIQRAQELVEPISAETIVLHVRGHVVFGIIRRAFLEACNKSMKRRPQMELRALLRLLSETFWRFLPPIGDRVKTAISGAAATISGPAMPQPS